MSSPISVCRMIGQPSSSMSRTSIESVVFAVVRIRNIFRPVVIQIVAEHADVAFDTASHFLQDRVIVRVHGEDQIKSTRIEIGCR